MVREALSATLFVKPTEIWVIPYAIPTEIKVTKIGPRRGSKNQFIKSITLITKIVPTKTDAKMVQKRFRVPPISADQKTAPTNPKPINQVIGTVGFAKKLLNEIARYSFNKTATQKTGKENIKKVKNVAE